MYNKKDLVKTLNEFNYFIDEVTLNAFIKNWKIDPIYEDEDGVDFYDNLAVAKLKKGISLKSQGFSNEQITYHVNKLLPEKLSEEKEKIQKADLPVAKVTPKGDIQNLTLDVTSQTLQMIADAVAEKITAGIKDSEFVKQILEDGALKKDNEALSQKIDELTEDNKKLAQRVAELEKNKKSCPINFDYFKNLFN